MSADMNLTDDLADVLSHMVVGWKPTLGVDLAEHPEVQRVMLRYREAKAEFENLVIHLDMKQAEVDAVFDKPQVSAGTSYECRKCGGLILPSQYRFGSPQTGWEHMEGECP
jgi:hypothetical protein